MAPRGIEGGGKGRAEPRVGRIHRILYSFGIPRTFTLIRRFAPIKEKFPLQVIIEGITALFTPKKAAPPVAVPRPKVPVPAPGLNIAIVLAIVLLFAIALIIIPLLLLPKAPPVVPEVPAIVVEPPVLSVSVADSGILDSGRSQRFFIAAAISGILDSAQLDLTVYRDPNPSEVFILKTTRLRASHYLEFIKEFKDTLADLGISASDITIDELLRLPEKSRIILIVPTGYMPELFVDGALDMKTFTERGNVLVFIGYPPTEGVIRKDTAVPQPVSSDIIADRFGLGFDPEKERPMRLNYTTALYVVRARPTEKVQPIVFARPGEASVQWRGQGYVYFIATTVDDWWIAAGNGSAHKLAEAVADAWWNVYYSSGSTTLQAENGTLGDTAVVLFTQPIPEREYGIATAYGRLRATATRTEDNVSASVGKTLDFTFRQRPNGRMEHDEEFISSFLTDRSLQIVYSLNETPELKHIYFNVVNASHANVSSALMAAEPVPLKVSRVTYRFFNSLPSGAYILRITDSDGRLLAQSYLKVPSFRVARYATNWMLGQFTFHVFYENATDPYRESLKHIKVSLDGKDETETEAVGGVISYNVTYAPSPGPHTFTFRIGADTVLLEIPYVREKALWERPEYIVMGLLGLLFFAIAFIVRPREEVLYSIDVPDFPPLHAIAIPVRREAILGLFDTINKELRWQFTPLTLHDLKAGFAKLTFRGRSIMIGDYNLETLLDQLVREGTVKSAIDYYGLAAWESQAGKSMYALAMQRALRDIFVTEGIPFTPFGQNPAFDTSVHVLGEKAFLHIYEEESVIERALATSLEGRTIIIFENEDAMRDFTRRIHSSATTNVSFKLHLDSPNGNIQLAPLNNIVDVLNKKYTFFYY